MPPTDKMRDAALKLAEQGYPVFPLRPNGKEPLTANGLKNATTLLDVVDRWWRGTPNANIGIRTGVVMDVLDIDVKPKLQKDGTYQDTPGMKYLEELQNQWPWVGHKCGSVVRTASGGLHLYFAPGGGRNSVSAELGIDFRATDGYVVAPPSHVIYPPDVKTYPGGHQGDFEFRSEREVSVTFDYVSMKALLLPKSGPTAVKVHAPRVSRLGLTRANTGRAGISGLLKWFEAAVDGNRNNRLNNTVHALFTEGNWNDTVEIRVRQIASDLGMDDAEVTKTIGSATSGKQWI